MKITGLMIQYYKYCLVELWYYLHGVMPNQNEKNIEIGRYIDKIYKKRKKIRNIVLDDSICIDIIDSFNRIIEIKKSSKINIPKLYQLFYYLYRLKKKGINAIGILTIPAEHKKIKINLTPKIETELKEIEEKIKEIKIRNQPPQIIKKPICKNCGYYFMCWC